MIPLRLIPLWEAQSGPTLLVSLWYCSLNTVILFITLYFSEEDENEEFEDMLNSMRDVLVSTGKIYLHFIICPLFH